MSLHRRVSDWKRSASSAETSSFHPTATIGVQAGVVQPAFSLCDLPEGATCLKRPRESFRGIRLLGSKYGGSLPLRLP